MSASLSAKDMHYPQPTRMGHAEAVSGSPSNATGQANQLCGPATVAATAPAPNCLVWVWVTWANLLVPLSPGLTKVTATAMMTTGSGMALTRNE